MNREEAKKLYMFTEMVKIRITVKPREVYLEFGLSKIRYRRRVKGYDLGE